MTMGLMQDGPLLISTLIEHASRFHKDAEIVSRTCEGPIHRCTYGDISRRAKQVANALAELGVKPGDRVATLAWNGYRHMELYYGVSGSGAVLHTINPRLFPEQIEYIANHAEDRFLFFDLTFVPLIEKLAPLMKTVKGFVLMTDRSHMPDCAIPGLLCYEELVGRQSSDYEWPVFDENTASSLCYTSGTTGNPKGVLYSHRSSVLHSFSACSADVLGLGAKDSALLIVPMFHVNAWGMPYAGAMCGARLVMPGPALDGKSVYELMRDEKVTLALGVPTVWLMLFQHVDANRLVPRDDLCVERVVIGGSAAPRAMCEKFETQFGAFVDLGVHQDGLVHVSQLAHKFVNDAREVVKTGDIVKVQVQEVDVARKRISLTMKIGAAPSGKSGANGQTAGDNRFQGTGRGQQGYGGRHDGGLAGNTAMASAFAKLKR